MAIKVSKPEINIREKLSDLDFDKVPFQKMPAGSVLQVVSSELNSFGTTSTSYVNTGLYVDISPKDINSKFEISAMLGGIYSSTSGGMVIRLVNGNTVIGENAQEVYNYSSAAFRRNGYYGVADTPHTLTTIRYEIQIRVRSGGTVEIANGASFSSLRVMEIAQ